MRVLLLGTGVQPIPPTGYGGVERTIADLAGALAAAGDAPRILQEVRRRRSIDEYWFARDLPRLLRSESYEALHASTPVVANQLARLGLRYVYTTHSRHWFERSGLTQRWGAFLERRAVRRAAHTIALTDRLAGRIRDETGVGGADRITTIPIGVDSSKFVPDWEHRTGNQALGVGVVAPIKRWEVAAEALRGSGMRLRIAGPIADPGYARAVVGRGDGVELLGEVDEPTLLRLFAESDLFLHPSRVELLPGAVVQALSAALPVVGTEVIAGVVHADVEGFVADSGATDSEIVRYFSRSIAQLRSDPALRRRMGEAGRRRAQSEYSWASVAAAHQVVYRKVAGEGQPTRR